jgi:hypothetical protein
MRSDVQALVEGPRGGEVAIQGSSRIPCDKKGKSVNVAKIW